MNYIVFTKELKDIVLSILESVKLEKKWEFIPLLNDKWILPLSALNIPNIENTIPDFNTLYQLIEIREILEEEKINVVVPN